MRKKQKTFFFLKKLPLKKLPKKNFRFLFFPSFFPPFFVFSFFSFRGCCIGAIFVVSKSKFFFRKKKNIIIQLPPLSPTASSLCPRWRGSPTTQTRALPPWRDVYSVEVYSVERLLDEPQAAPQTVVVVDLDKVTYLAWILGHTWPGQGHILGHDTWPMIDGKRVAKVCPHHRVALTVCACYSARGHAMVCSTHSPLTLSECACSPAFPAFPHWYHHQDDREVRWGGLGSLRWGRPGREGGSLIQAKR